MPENKADTNELLLHSLPDLLDGIKPQLILDLLKERDELGAVVLSGFRPTPQSLKMPVVRQRLMREIERDSALLDSLTAHWAECNQVLWGRVALSAAKELEGYLGDLSKEHGRVALKVALTLDDRHNVRALAAKVDRLGETPAAAEPVKERPRARKQTAHDPAVETLRAENKQLKLKVKEFQQKQKDHERRLVDARAKLEKERAELKAARQQIAERQKELDKSEKLADRVRRAKEASDYELSLVRRDMRRLEKELKDLKSPEPVEPVELPATHSPDPRPEWTKVVSLLIRNGSYETARVFCEQLKEMDPENLQAHIALEQIYAKMEEFDRQIDECGWIATYWIRTNHPVRACVFAVRSLAIDPTQHRIQLQFRRVLEAVELTDEPAVSGIRRLLARLKLSNVLAHRQAVKVIKQMGKPHAKAYEGPREHLHPDKVFGLSYGERSLQLSTRRIIDAVDRNESFLVEFVQHALPNLRRSRPTLYRRIIENIEHHDRSYITTIINQTQPVVVDGSNVAWHEAEGKARLQNILDVLTELRFEGYFPIYTYVDASLPYQIDQPSQLQEMINSGALTAVESRTCADETIIAKAKSLGCSIVSNDRMTDWDPSDEVSKVKFVIDSHGLMIYGR